jgi:hypothetical protein
MKMRDRLIWISLNAPAKPIERLKVRVGCKLTHSDKHEPQVGASVPRGQSKSLLNVPLDFLAAPQFILAKPDESMRFGQIPIERQRLPTLSNASSNTVRLN